MGKQKKYSVTLFLAIFLVFTLNACSSGSSSSVKTRLTATPSSVASSPTATPLPHGAVLYQGDYDLGIHYEWHDYRLEIHGALLTFYLDNQITGRATSQAGSFVNGPIRLELSSIGVQVSEFRVVVP